MVALLLLLPLILIGGVIYILNIENKKMENNQTQSVGEISHEKRNPAFHLFLYLVSFLSLGFLVAGILISIHQAINKFIPDSLNDNSYFDNDAIKFGLSALIVTIPLYYGILFLLNKKLERKEIPAESLVRKTITYLALVAFSGMAIGSLVTIMYNYFDGELTTRFVLKALSFFLVSLFFFGFYFWEIRRNKFVKNVFMTFFLSSLAISIFAMILGFFVIDSPKVAREKRIDNELIGDMREAGRKINMKFKGENDSGNNEISRQAKRDEMAMELAKQGKSLEEIEAFLDKLYGARKKGELPTEGGMKGQIDSKITYKPGEKGKYELCGTFKGTENGKGDDSWRSNSVQWAHSSGYYCFKFDAETSDYNATPIQIKTN